MKQIWSLGLALSVLSTVAVAAPVAQRSGASKRAVKATSSVAKRRIAQVGSSDRPHIDIVFAIDCSGSMGGVIETAKQKVWDIVNEVAKAKPSPVLRIGLLGYGNGSSTFRSYDLSEDLDTVYGHLMTFHDEGWSDEYVGLAVDKSVKEMSWAPKSEGPSLRVLYVVGNETAQQGPLSFLKTTPNAVTHSVIVNAIYCGNSGGQDTWQKMATLGKGSYLTIAGDGGGVMIATPYDKSLATLNSKLNGTYLAYGVRRREAAQNQAAQDSAAARVGGAYSTSSRAMAKASSQYSNSGWDLVDAARDKKFDVNKIPASQLPPAMQKMTPNQRNAYVAQRAAERRQIQTQIGELGRKREAYIRAKSAENKRKVGAKDSLDGALRTSVRSQAMRNGFKF